MINKKKIIYYLTEVVFTLLSCLYTYLLTIEYITLSSYDFKLFVILLLVLIGGIWILGPALNRIFCFLFLGLYSLYIISQAVYNTAFHTYYRFNMALSLRNEVAGVNDSIAEFLRFEYFIPFIILFVFIVVFTAMYFLFQRKVVSFKERIATLCVGVITIVPVVYVYGKFENQIKQVELNANPFNLYNSDYYYYLTFNNNSVFVERFGLLTFMHRDIISLAEESVVSEKDSEEIENFLNDRNHHMDNDYTGIFEGKNVLFIQAESFMDIAVNEQLTPNIYKLKNQGIEIVGFDTPATPGSTSDSEFAANTSLIPNSGGQASCYMYENNTFKTTLPGIFNNNGYATSLYHNCYGQFYNRNVFLKNVGYDELLFCTDFGENGDLPDLHVANTLKWIVNADYPYMGYWITYSGHQPYNYESVGVYDYDVEKIRELYPNLDEEYVAYLAKQMDLDHSIGEILQVLDNSGLSNNTVIVFFGDHIVKGLDFGEGSKFYEQTGLEYKKSNTNTSLYFYNPTIKPEKYEKTSTLLDLLPTIANLWNFEIDYSTFVGRDIFDENYGGFRYSEWGNWSTDNVEYNLSENSYSIKEGSSMSIEDAREEMEYYLKMKDISTKILDFDYFGKGDK